MIRPITVTAKSPLSCSITSETAKTAISTENRTGTFRNSGTTARAEGKHQPAPGPKAQKGGDHQCPG